MNNPQQLADAVASYDLSQIQAFLCGESSLDGLWFGDRHPTERGAFWWRKHLRSAIEREENKTLSRLQSEREKRRAAIERARDALVSANTELLCCAQQMGCRVRSKQWLHKSSVGKALTGARQSITALTAVLDGEGK